jgi:hypothetical protein
LEVYNHICEFRISDSVEVSFFPETIIDLQSNKIGDLCDGDSVSLWLNNIYKDILWSTNEKSDTIKVKQSGTYTATIIDTNGCEWSKSIDVVFNPLPEAEIQVLGKYAFCDGDSTILATKVKYSSYQWFEERNTDSIFSKAERVVIKSPGRFAVIVTNEFGCKDTSEYITIEVWDMTNRLSISSYSNTKELIFDTLGLTKMQCMNLLVQNLSETEVLLHSMILAYNIEFSIPKNQIPIILSPGESIDLLVCFRPLGMNQRKDTIFIGDTCSTHTIPLIGWGKANEYKGDSDCGVELKFRTDSLMGAEYFNTSSPFPNPTTGNIMVKHSAIGNLEMRYELRNTMGNLIQEGFLDLNKCYDNDKKWLFEGETTFNLENFSEGIYYLLIRTQSGIHSYPIVLIK